MSMKDRNEKFEVNDRVVIDGGKRQIVGTVIRISPKRGDIIVKWDNNDHATSTFDKCGCSKGDAWHINWITHYTVEIQKAWDKERVKIICMYRLDELRKADKITYELAQQILDIINPAYKELKGETK